MYYSSFGLLALVLHVIINHYVLNRHVKEELSAVTKRYRAFLYSLLAFYSSDILWGVLYESRIIPLAYTDTVLFFATMVLSVLLWSRFVVAYLNRDNLFSKILTYAGLIIFWGEMVCLVINIFFPILFSFDSTKEYRPALGRYVTLSVQVALFFFTSFYAFFIMSKTAGKQKSRHKTIAFSGMIMTVFIILQSMFPLAPLYAVGCLVATCLVHTFVVQDEKKDYNLELGSAKHMAYTDPLTGVKNAHAYIDAKKHVDQRIMNGTMQDFGIIVFDLNGLKTINDTLGHEMGDKYIKSSCSYICRQFKHSPVYRVGGDEFVILLESEDFIERERLLETFEKKIEQNKKEGLAVVSSGMSVYIPGEDTSIEDVFRRADQEMYSRKKFLKEQ